MNEKKYNIVLAILSLLAVITLSVMLLTWE